MRCRNCGSENRNTNIRCDFCGADLISEYNNVDQNFQKIFLGNNLTRSTKNYAKILKDKDLSEEEKKRILAAEKKKQEDDIIL